MAALKGFEERPSAANWPENWQGVARVCVAAARQANQTHLDAAYCYLAHEIDFSFTEHMRQEFTKAFQ